MRKFANLIVLLCCLAFVFALVPCHLVQAANPTILVGDQMTATLGRGEKLIYSFTPLSTGHYVVWIAQPDAMYNFTWDVRNAATNDGIYCDRFEQENYQGGMYMLQGGVTYNVMLWQSDGGTSTRTFGLAKAETTTGISFAEANKTGYVGNEWILRLILSAPAAVDNAITWTSSDSAIVSVEKNDLASANLKLLKSGTATVTATAGSFSANCVIHVQDLNELELGKTSCIYNPKEGPYEFTFTPETSGKYIVYTNQMIPIGIVPLDRYTENTIQNGGQAIVNTLSAGQQYTYTVFVTKWLEDTGIKEIPVRIEQLTQTTDPTQPSTQLPTAPTEQPMQPPSEPLPQPSTSPTEPQPPTEDNDSSQTVLMCGVEDFLSLVEQADSGLMVVVLQSGFMTTFPNKDAFMLSSDRNITVLVSMDIGSISLDAMMQEKIQDFFTEMEVSVSLEEKQFSQIDSIQLASLEGYCTENVCNPESIISASIYYEEQCLHDFDGRTATVRLTGYDQSKIYMVLYLHPEGAIEEIDCHFEDDELVFEASHFSEFAIVSVDSTQTEPTDEPTVSTEPKQEPPFSTQQQPPGQSGRETEAYLIAVLCVVVSLVAIVVAVFVNKRRK